MVSKYHPFFFFFFSQICTNITLHLHVCSHFILFFFDIFFLWLSDICVMFAISKTRIKPKQTRIKKKQHIQKKNKGGNLEEWKQNRQHILKPSEYQQLLTVMSHLKSHYIFVLILIFFSFFFLFKKRQRNHGISKYIPNTHKNIQTRTHKL